MLKSVQELEQKREELIKIFESHKIELMRSAKLVLKSKLNKINKQIVQRSMRQYEIEFEQKLPHYQQLNKIHKDLNQMSQLHEKIQKSQDVFENSKKFITLKENASKVISECTKKQDDVYDVKIKLDEGIISNIKPVFSFHKVICLSEQIENQISEIIHFLGINPSLLNNNYYKEFKANEQKLEKQRGGVKYQPPIGWKRIGLKVDGKYDNGNDDWLGSCNGPGEWPVSYHGMGSGGSKAVLGIINDGYKVQFQKRMVFGRGNYSLRDYKIAQGFGFVINIQNEKYVLVFQNRYNPQNSFVVNNQISILSQNADIRAYGLLYKKL